VAAALLDSIGLLARSCDVLRRHCVKDLEADEARCRAHVETSTAITTALLPALGYEGACRVAAEAARTGRSVRQTVLENGLLTPEQVDALTSPEAVCRLGTPPTREDT
jgi:aspartate ammonia-lyase